MNCGECGVYVEVWGCVMLCDRCLAARLWRELKEDDFVLIRRRPGGNIWLTSMRSGGWWSTDLTALRLDPLSETVERVVDFLQPS